MKNGFTPNSGGGIFVNSAVTINNSLITDNYAAVGGGGIYGVGNITLNNSTVENNSAERGAGIDLYSLNSLTLNNSTIGGNQATNLGGGIYMNGISGSGTANITIQNSTITNNSALTGGGIYSGGSSPRRNLTITNSILYGNTATTGGDCAGAGLSPISSSNHNIFGDLSNCGIIAGVGDQVGVNPQLENSPSGDLHYFSLKPISPAINTGGPVCLSTDQRGVVRPQGMACDIGSFEFDAGDFPIINIMGNSLPIVNGDVTPSITDSTDFGNGIISGVVVEHTFTIENWGFAPLNLAATPKVVIGGTNASDFSVTTEPADSIAVGGNTTFVVSFDPLAAGVRTASVSISSNDSFSTPYTFNIQGVGVSIPPTVSSILRNDVNPTKASSVVFTVNFSESVTGVDVNDFTLSTTGVTGSSIATVTGTGSVYDVSVNTGSGSGTIRLNIPATAVIVNGAGTQLSGLPYQSGQSYTIDKTAPTVLTNTYYGPSPTYYSNIQLFVNFSEVVKNVDLNDFSLTTTGVQGATITSISGSSSSYTVYINTGTGDGTIRVDVPATATITDGVGNPIGNLPFTNGKVIQIVRADQSTDAAFLDGSFGNNGGDR